MKKFWLSFCACVLILGFSIFFGSGLVDAHAENDEDLTRQRYYKSIEIQSGDTLWNLAETYMSKDNGSIKDHVQALMEMNGLTSDEIHEGQYLTVVYYDAEFR